MPLPNVNLGERFAGLHERFDVNTQAIAQVLGNIGLGECEIDAFKVDFEDRFVVGWLGRLRFDDFSTVAPGLGWSVKGENGIHVTGLDDNGLPIHPNQRVYGHTILHEIGHVDYMRRKPDARTRFRREERLADRFARRNIQLMEDLVDYEVNQDAVDAIVAKLGAESLLFREQTAARHIKETSKVAGRK